MNKLKLRFPKQLAFALLAAAVFALPSFASYYVNDAADLFTDEEESELETYAQTLSDDYGMVFAVLTSEEENSDSLDYADIYYENTYGLDTDGMVFFIDMYNRVPTVSTSGLMIDYITDSRLNELLDGCGGYLSNGDYYSAASVTLEQAGNFVYEGIPAGHERIDGDLESDGGFHFSPLALIIGLAAGALTAVIIKSAVGGGYELKGSTYSYNFRGLSKVRETGKTDRFIRSNRVVTPKAQNNDSGNNSTTHSSSSGGTHGGGSGKSF